MAAFNPAELIDVAGDTTQRHVWHEWASILRQEASVLPTAATRQLYRSLPASSSSAAGTPQELPQRIDTGTPSKIGPFTRIFAAQQLLDKCVESVLRHPITSLPHERSFYSLLDAALQGTANQHLRVFRRLLLLSEKLSSVESSDVLSGMVSSVCLALASLARNGDDVDDHLDVNGGQQYDAVVQNLSAELADLYVKQRRGHPLSLTWLTLQHHMHAFAKHREELDSLVCGTEVEGDRVFSHPLSEKGVQRADTLLEEVASAKMAVEEDRQLLVSELTESIDLASRGISGCDQRIDILGDEVGELERTKADLLREVDIINKKLDVAANTVRTERLKRSCLEDEREGAKKRLAEEKAQIDAQLASMTLQLRKAELAQAFVTAVREERNLVSKVRAQQVAIRTETVAYHLAVTAREICEKTQALVELLIDGSAAIKRQCHDAVMSTPHRQELRDTVLDLRDQLDVVSSKMKQSVGLLGEDLDRVFSAVCTSPPTVVTTNKVTRYDTSHAKNLRAFFDGSLKECSDVVEDVFARLDSVHIDEVLETINRNDDDEMSQASTIPLTRRVLPAKHRRGETSDPDLVRHSSGDALDRGAEATDEGADGEATGVAESVVCSEELREFLHCFREYQAHVGANR